MRSVRLAVAVVLTFTAASVAHGQSIGVEGGWAHSRLSGPVEPLEFGLDAGADRLNSLAVGAFIDVPVTPAFALSAEVLYVPKVTATYWEMPLLARLAIPLGIPVLKPSVFAGPYLAIVGRCSMQGAGTATGYSLSCDDAPVTSTDVGLAFGGGLAFPLAGKVDGMVQARYDLGLKTVEESAASASLRTRALMLFAGISIPLRLHRVESAVRAR